MTLQERQQMYLDFLIEEGLEASINEEGDVVFQHEGHPFYIIIDEDDAEYFQLFFPAFCTIEDVDDKEELYAEIFGINASVKVATLVILEDLVHASVEFFCSPPESFKTVFRDSFESLVTAVNAFLDLMGVGNEGDENDEDSTAGNDD
ncbi:MAG: hypothetical protein GX130_10885 [Candidatus Hydrogenedens sp.]|jgi:hypothetical protein|nr:hypothetical protein [Candidatus Hydrogenedens sp.]